LNLNHVHGWGELNQLRFHRLHFNELWFQRMSNSLIEMRLHKPTSVLSQLIDNLHQTWVRNCSQSTIVEIPEGILLLDHSVSKAVKHIDSFHFNILIIEANHRLGIFVIITLINCHSWKCEDSGIFLLLGRIQSTVFFFVHFKWFSFLEMLEFLKHPISHFVNHFHKCHLK
jgi:hypothetical protein